MDPSENSSLKAGRCPGPNLVALHSAPDPWPVSLIRARARASGSVNTAMGIERSGQVTDVRAQSEGVLHRPSSTNPPLLPLGWMEAGPQPCVQLIQFFFRSFVSRLLLGPPASKLSGSSKAPCRLWTRILPFTVEVSGAERDLLRGVACCAYARKGGRSTRHTRGNN